MYQIIHHFWERIRALFRNKISGIIIKIRIVTARKDFSERKNRVDMELYYI